MKKKRLGSIVLMIAVAVAVIAGWILASGYFTVKNAGYTMETMEDVLEELVGEIYDERDEVVTEFTEVTPDTYEISGDMPVDDFLDEIDYHPADIEEDDYDTMNGLALSVLEHIPAVGETFQLGRLTFTVLEMEEQKIEKMRISLAPDPEKEAEKAKEKEKEKD